MDKVSDPIPPPATAPRHTPTMPLQHLSFHTAGESHGRGLVAVLEGVPAGMPLDPVADIDPDLRRRMGGYGRGRRMLIESDRAEIMSGLRLGVTLGSPVSMLIWNRDWKNWTTAMAHEPPDPEGNPKALRPVYLPRPGHADLAGVLKYDRRDARDILERASARETAARVACGAVARTLLREVGATIGSHVTRIGDVEARTPDELPDDLNAASDPSPVRTLDPEAEGEMIAAIDATREAGDTLGGCFEVVVRGLPVGLGSYVSWDRKLDGRLAQAVMSVHAIKGVEIGPAFVNAARPGSRVHDAILRDADERRAGGFARARNRAGGLEGGHQHRLSAGRAGGDEAHLHAAAKTAAERRPERRHHETRHRRTQRRVRRTRRRGRRGGDGRTGRRRRPAREVRR